jgi:hypothetical protein
MISGGEDKNLRGKYEKDNGRRKKRSKDAGDQREQGRMKNDFWALCWILFKEINFMFD